jgi:hypothetical protein
MRYLKLFTVVFLLLCTISFAAEWTNLFDGKTLNGWSIHSGTATYKIEDGAIVGTTAKGSPNSFLCTDKQYKNFILEFDVFLDSPELNSGVQFRSKIAKKEMVFLFADAEGNPRKRTISKDRVYGYQVEIANSENGSSGGVYDEACRGFFLQNINKDPKASKAFKDGEWNTYRVECDGNSIKTSINDIPCSDFEDSLNPKGVFGLQVHGIGDRPGPLSVRWRNIRLMELE